MQKGAKLLPKEFFDALALKLHIKNPSDWGTITKRQVIFEGGATFIQKNDGSVLKTLQNTYPETNWKVDWFQNLKSHPKGFWDNKNNQKRFLESLLQKLGLQEISELISVPASKVLEHGGSTLLCKYNNSWLGVLRSLYPEYTWKEEHLENKRKGYWQSKENQFEFMKSIAKKYQIKEPRDWARITTQEIVENGGKNLLFQYQGSLYHVLEALFPETEWDKTSLVKPNGYWDNFQNSRKGFERIATISGIRKPKDWGKMTIRKFISLGGRGLLSKFDGNLFTALQSVYTEVKWKREWFPSLPKYNTTFWKSQYNQKAFLENIAVDYNIKVAKDWSKVTISLIRKRGGGALLTRYNNSISLALKTLFHTTDSKTSLNISEPQFHVLAFLNGRIPT